jgi:hypothetical protein
VYTKKIIRIEKIQQQLKFSNNLTAAVKFSRNLSAADKYLPYMEKYFPIRKNNFLFERILSYWDESFGHTVADKSIRTKFKCA